MAAIVIAKARRQYGRLANVNIFAASLFCILAGCLYRPCNIGIMPGEPRDAERNLRQEARAVTDRTEDHKAENDKRALARRALLIRLAGSGGLAISHPPDT